MRRTRNTRPVFVITVFLTFSLIMCVQPIVAATSIVGVTGLVDIPTARIIPDGKVAFGVGYTDREYSLRSPKYHQVAYYVTVGYLPFLEASLRVTSFPGNMQSDDYGSEKDRMASVKLLLVSEGPYLPSILLGVHDILGVYNSENPEANVNFNTAYVVMSKSVHFTPIGYLDVHLGYASDILAKDAAHHSMLGLFAGLEKRLCRYLSVMGEYDTQKYNIGLRLTSGGDRANIDLIILGLKHISGGISVSFGL